MVKKATKKKATKKRATRKLDDNTLPKEVRDQLRTARPPSGASHVAGVLNKVKPMSMNEIIIAIWMQHRVVAKRASVQSQLSLLKKKGEVRRCGHGSYVLAK